LGLKKTGNASVLTTRLRVAWRKREKEGARFGTEGDTGAGGGLFWGGTPEWEIKEDRREEIGTTTHLRRGNR